MVQLQIWVIVENNTVCIAASIPALRPLLRKRHSASSGTSAIAGEYGSWSKGLSSKRFTQDQRNMNRLEVQHHDGNSEEYILSHVHEMPADQITKTTDVLVAYENGSGNIKVSRAADGMSDFLSDPRNGMSKK